MARNVFEQPKFVDHVIMDETGAKVGEIRVKPSGILWSPKGSHKWHRVDLETFADFMKENGTEQDK
jgi:hypothetical protein